MYQELEANNKQIDTLLTTIFKNHFKRKSCLGWFLFIFVLIFI